MKDIPLEKQIETAIQDLNCAMRENIEAAKSEVDAKIRKEKARYSLQKARERLDGVYRQAME